ncbi:type II secretion system F family protein [Thalassospira xiamenensis]|uniref:Type II secretory pathway, component PulF n=1 Tax=Thalassospira xiamenensis TaxID=220697 RepID=A0A285TTH5_9PROT|nr:type II secretion system F family protein [Thalassospira xiamenensis]SOC27064.1 Type II secretory pathway, component PulF [Thalassospira xiamenensis]
MNLDNLNRSFSKLQFGGKQRIRVYRKLVSYLTNGVDLIKALKIMWQHASDDGRRPDHPTAIAVLEWLTAIENGKPLSTAFGSWIPDTDRVVISAGEAGNLPQALENAVFIAEGGKRIKSTIYGGIAYPILLSTIAIGFMAMFGLQIIPAFDEVVPKEQWTGLASYMALMADFVNGWMFPLLGAFIGFMMTILFTLPRWTGKLRVKFDKYPPWSIYRLLSGTGFMLSVSALVKAGVQIPEILRILQKGANPWFFERMSSTLRYVSAGKNLGDALYATGYGYPDMETVRDLRSFSELENFDDMLEKLGREWLNESVEKITKQMNVLRNLSIVFLGAVFGLISGGIFALQQQVT